MKDREDLIEEAVEAGLAALKFGGKALEVAKGVAAEHGTTFTEGELTRIEIRIQNRWSIRRRRIMD